MAEETAGQGSAPTVAPPHDFASAVDAVKRKIQPQGPSETAPKAKPEAKPEPAEVKTEAETEQPKVEETTEVESVQPEPTETSDELPETLDEIAEALGVKTDALIKALKVSTKDGSKATVADLLEGQLRDKDYRQKTMELAETRRQMEAQAAQYLGTLRQRADTVTSLEAMMAHELQLDNQALDAMLKDEYTEPMAFERKKAERDKRVQILNALVYQRQVAQQQAQEAQASEAARWRQSQQELLIRAMPELKDGEKQAALQRQLSSYLGDLGFSKQEVANYFGGTWDHRHIQILHEAARYRVEKAASRQTVKKLAELPKVAKPGSGTQTSSEARQQSVAGLREKLRHARGKGRRAGMALAQAYVKAQLGGN